MSIHYESKMLNLQDRLEMSETSWNMLKAYEDFQTGKMDRDQLRRKIRLSPQNRASMTNTIIQLAENKTVLSKEDKYCSGIISAMAEMIKIGGKYLFGLRIVTPFANITKTRNRPTSVSFS